MLSQSRLLAFLRILHMVRGCYSVYFAEKCIWFQFMERKDSIPNFDLAWWWFSLDLYHYFIGNHVSSPVTPMYVANYTEEGCCSTFACFWQSIHLILQGMSIRNIQNYNFTKVCWLTCDNSIAFVDWFLSFRQ